MSNEKPLAPLPFMAYVGPPARLCDELNRVYKALSGPVYAVEAFFKNLICFTDMRRRASNPDWGLQFGGHLPPVVDDFFSPSSLRGWSDALRCTKSAAHQVMRFLTA